MEGLSINRQVYHIGSGTNYVTLYINGEWCGSSMPGISFNARGELDIKTFIQEVREGAREGIETWVVGKEIPEPFPHLSQVVYKETLGNE